MDTEQKVRENDEFNKRNEVWSCCKLESRDEAEAEQVVCWIRTCGLYPENRGQSMNDLNLGRDAIRVTCLKDHSGLIRERIEVW